MGHQSKTSARMSVVVRFLFVNCRRARPSPQRAPGERARHCQCLLRVWDQPGRSPVRRAISGHGPPSRPVSTPFADRDRPRAASGARSRQPGQIAQVPGPERQDPPAPPPERRGQGGALSPPVSDTPTQAGERGWRMLVFQPAESISAVRGPRELWNWGDGTPTFLSGCRNWIFWNCFAGGWDLELVGAGASWRSNANQVGR